MYRLTWLPEVLRAAGLKVVETPGWQTRGHGDVGTIKGVICHHTADRALKNTAPDIKVVTNGRPDLAGPLAQLVLGYDGTYYVIAAGKAWHAGAGLWQGVHDGNSQMIGIEAENSGLADDWPWPEAQMTAYAKGVAAILKHIGAPPLMCCGHLEWAIPVGRKSDPSFSIGTRAARIVAMDAFRQRIASIMGHPIEAAVAPDATGTENLKWVQATLNTFIVGPDALDQLRGLALLKTDGIMGPKTIDILRRYQAIKRIPGSGGIDPATLKALHADLDHKEGCRCQIGAPQGDSKTQIA